MNITGKTRRERARFTLPAIWIALALLCFVASKAFAAPVALVVSHDARELYVADDTANDVAVINVNDGIVSRRIALPEATGGLVLSPDGGTLYVAHGAAAGSVAAVDISSGQIVASVAVGHTPLAPVISADGTRLYVCNRFTNDISVIDLAAKAEIVRIGVLREPVASALTRDGRFLFVANLLPDGPSDGDFVAAAVSVIDTVAGTTAGTVRLPNGASGVRGLCVSPDGAYVYATHILARYQMPTTQIERGWMNTNAFSVISVEPRALVNTVLLDDVTVGAANPWAVACSADGRYLCVSHAGTHELSVIDRLALHGKLDTLAAGTPVSEVSRTAADVPYDLSFLVGLRRRIRLGGNGPRALAIAGTVAFLAEHFSESLSTVDIAAEDTAAKRLISLGTNAPMTPERKGEMLFNDGTLCFQQWQSCATCHPDARADGLNWDLLNDGLGSPRNTKSMLLSHQTPPVMSLGIRETAEKAVRAGIRFIQFVERPEADASAIDSYLKSMKPVASPRLVRGELSEAARKGSEVFERAGCAACHPEGLYTDLRPYDVGTTKDRDSGKPLDTPTLVEVWRTAPYLHDGRAATLADVLTRCNPDDRHGATTSLSPDEIEQLAEFVLSQ